MKIAVSTLGTDLNAPVDMRFGRSPYFLIVNTDDLSFEVVNNPHMNASGGAGIQAAQLIGNKGVEAIISGVMGPNAYQTLQAIGIPVYQTTGGTVRNAVEAFKSNQLSQLTQPGPAHAGMGGGRGMGRGGGMGAGRGMGMGRAQPFNPPSQPMQNQPSSSGTSTGNELNKLREQVEEITQKLGSVVDRIKKLENQKDKK